MLIPILNYFEYNNNDISFDNFLNHTVKPVAPIYIRARVAVATPFKGVVGPPLKRTLSEI